MRDDDLHRPTAPAPEYAQIAEHAIGALARPEQLRAIGWMVGPKKGITCHSTALVVSDGFASARTWNSAVL